jgi:hypothetical protein
VAYAGNGAQAIVNHAVRVFLFVIAILLGCGSAYASHIVVVGKLVTNEPMTDLENECSDGELCMHRWWKPVIQVEKTLEGQPISGRVTAAVSQHVPMNEKYKKAVRYFTLESIEDPAIREHLHAEYYLEEGSIDPPGKK